MYFVSIKSENVPNLDILAIKCVNKIRANKSCLKILAMSRRLVVDV